MKNSTSLKNLRAKYKKSISIIIGKTEGNNKVSIDGIVIHSAYTFSNKVGLIEGGESLRGLKYDIIYLSGHGDARDFTIGNRSVDEIADLLMDMGYCGQQIYISSCESNKVVQTTIYGVVVSMSICDALNILLSQRLGHKMSDCSRIVWSDADGSTITVRDGEETGEGDEDGTLEVYILSKNEEKLARKFHLKELRAISHPAVRKALKNRVQADCIVEKHADIQKKIQQYYGENYDVIQIFKSDMLLYVKAETNKRSKKTNIE